MSQVDNVRRKFQGKKPKNARTGSRKVRDNMGMSSAKFLEGCYYGIKGVHIVEPTGYATCGKPLVLFGGLFNPWATHQEKKAAILDYVAYALDEGQIHDASYEAYTRLTVNTVPYRNNFKDHTKDSIIPTCSSRVLFGQEKGGDPPYSIHTPEPTSTPAVQYPPPNTMDDYHENQKQQQPSVQKTPLVHSESYLQAVDDMRGALLDAVATFTGTMTSPPG